MSLGPEGTGFRITGIVERRHVPPSGKCAFLVLSYPGEKKRQKIDLITFASDMIVEVGSLGVGETVTVTGGIGSTCAKNKAREEVQVDGRALWYPQLIVKTVKKDEEKKKEDKKSTSWEDDDRKAGVDW